MTVMMRGKPVADKIKEELQAKFAGKQVTLAIVVVGDDAASHVYKNRLVKMAQSLGVLTREVLLPATATQEAVLEVVQQLNEDTEVTGILPMMPLPKPLDGDAVGAAVAPEKDMDCLNPLNAGELYLGRSPWAPCTPRACMAILAHYQIDLAGKQVVVLGRSNVVGKPVANLLLQQNATVTICHSKTQNLSQLLQEADVIVAAIGRAEFVQPEMVQDGVVIVDVGINQVGDKLVGDVAASVADKASAFTPVPGGVGVVSNVMVMETLTRNM